MNPSSTDKKIWVVVEPMLYIHTGIFVGAILRDREVLREYDVRFVASKNGIAVEPVTQEIRKEFGSDFEFHSFDHPDLRKRSSFLDSIGRAWSAVRSVSQFSKEERKVDFMTFLWIDSLVKLMAIPFVGSLCRELHGKIGGIFFNSRCFREEGWKAKFHRFLILRGIRSGAFYSIHFLDHGACELTKKYLPKRFHQMLHPGVDPWPGSLPETSSVARSGELNLLTFGAHSERKGTLKLLQMLRDHPEETQNYHLSIVGTVRDDIRERFDSTLAEISNPDERLTIVDRFVEDEEMIGYFKQANVILCPYVDFHGSSNVVIRAAANKLPVVVPPFSFLQELVSEKNLGEVAKANEASEILKAIQKIEAKLQETPMFYHQFCEHYAVFHQESRFARSLLPE